MSTSTVHVSTPSRSYDVLIGQGVIDEVGALTRKACGGSAACVIADDNVAPLYANAVAESLADAGYRTTLQVFPAGERHKRLSTLSDLLEDMGGLAAALYLRGCKVVQVPTSLLAMVDSSVGGKTAVDLEAGKNLAGAFFQPSLVVADVDCLDTLTPELFTDSCGEVIKHGVIRDEALFRSLAAHPINAEGFDRQELADVIRRNVQIKRDVVDADERERGLRQILNFGHTIGHAIEAASDFALGHGSSVAAGMCCIARASARMGWCAQDVADDIVAAVAAYGLPTDTAVDHDTLLSFATHDKKRHGSTVNVVVPTRIGAVEVRTVSLPEFRHLVDLGCGTGAA